VRFLLGDAVRALSAGALGGLCFQSAPATKQRDKAAYRVALPSGGFDDFGQRRSPGAAHQVNNLSFLIRPPRFGVRPSFGVARFLCRLDLGALCGFSSAFGLVGRLSDVAGAVAESLLLPLCAALIPSAFASGSRIRRPSAPAQFRVGMRSLCRQSPAKVRRMIETIAILA